MKTNPFFIAVAISSLLLLGLSACSSTERQTVKRGAKKSGNEVKGAFLHVGGELEEFFTGDRTVDR